MILIKSEEKKKLLGNVISLFVLQGSNYLIPLFSIPFLFKRLDVEKFGLVNFAFAFMQYFIILTDFGYNLSATKSIAEHREDKQKTQLIFNSVMGSKFLLFLTGFIVLLAIVFLFPIFLSTEAFSFYLTVWCLVMFFSLFGFFKELRK